MRHKYQSGSSLVEVLVVMAVGGVIAMLSIKLLQQTYASSHRAEQWLDLERNVQQLEYHLRRDLRAADQAEIPDPQTLLISNAERQVRFTIHTDHLERVERAGESILQTEAYRLPGVVATFAEPEQETVVVILGLQSEGGITQKFTLRQGVGR